MNVNTIDAAELKQKQDADKNLLLIDVRELHEWQSLRIPSAHHIPQGELPATITSLVPNKQQPIYLHCQGGVRSLNCAQHLAEMGYEAVYSLNGGIAQWAALGLPVESGLI